MFRTFYKYWKFLAIWLAPFLLSSCAFLHSVHISDIDSKIVNEGTKFEVLVSETGLNLQEATNTAKVFTNDQKTKGDMQKVNDIISMFQMGPRTGNMVFNDTYADNLFKTLKEKCPKGQISGLMSIRETAKYPVVSGEIVKITGYCLGG